MEKDKLSKTEYDIIQFQLVTKSIEYCKRFMELNGGGKNKSIPDKVTNSINQLTELRLFNSLNYKELSTVKNKYQSEIESSDSLHSSMRVYKKLRSFFPNMMIMSYKDFNDIMETYDLTNVRSDYFTGSIPSENINDLSNYMDMLSSLNSSDYPGLNRIINSISHKLTSSSCYYVDKIEYTPNPLFKKEFNFIIDNLTKRNRVIPISLAEYVVNKLSEFIGISKEEATEFYKSIVRSHFNMSSSCLRSSNIFIACPKEMTISCVTRNEKVLENNIRSSKIARDPIANIYTPIGMGIITSWGKESHDEVLVRYKTELGIL